LIASNTELSTSIGAEESFNKRRGRVQSFYLPLSRKDTKKNKIEGQSFASWGLSGKFSKIDF